MENEFIRNRNLGEVYTPETVSRLLYRTVQEVVPNFNKDCVIWDCCWGTGNLTKYFEFDRLFCSTLRKIDIRKNKANNPNATKFTYDFLNTDVRMLESPHAMISNESSLPEELEQAFKNKEHIMFYINPPYITPYSSTNKRMGYESEIDDRGSDVESEVKDWMSAEGFGKISTQTYAQFLYKIVKMKQAYNNPNVSLALISPTMFLAGNGASDFRKLLLQEFHLENAYLFKAGEFKGLSNDYGIATMYWGAGASENINDFPFKIVRDFTDIDNQTEFDMKTVYNCDGVKNLTTFLKEHTSQNLYVSEYTATSGVRIGKENPNKVLTSPNSLGYFFFKSNNPYHYKECGIMTAPYRAGSGMDISQENLDVCIASASARISTGRYGRSWIDDKDEYMAPNTKHEEWERFVLNCYMYMQFTGQTHIVSANIDGKEFPNKLFHLSYEYMDKLFKKYGAEIKTPEKREDGIVVQKIKQLLSNPDILYPHGLELWQAGLQMWDDTMERRLNGFADPMYQVERWDAGFYQIKQLTKDENKLDYIKEFNKIFKEYEIGLRKQLVVLGYLK